MEDWRSASAPSSAGPDGVVNIGDGAQRAFAQITGLVAVAKLDGFVLASGCSGGNRCAAHAAIGKDDIGLNSGIAAAVQDLAAENLGDFHDSAYRIPPPFRIRSEVWGLCAP